METENEAPLSNSRSTSSIELLEEVVVEAEPEAEPEVEVVLVEI